MNGSSERSHPWKAGLVAGLLLSGILSPPLSAQEFVRRAGNSLTLGGSPFLFIGANAYDLPRMAAAGRRAEVDAVIASAASLGLTVLRTWAFYDSSDPSAVGAMQVGPGGYREEGLRGLDYVVARARSAGIRLILPLVNSWDEFGGMNQYVRWRSGLLGPPGAAAGGERTDLRRTDVPRTVISGTRGTSYRVFPVGGGRHDDFYTDSVIVEWFRAYCAMLAQRVNVHTGVAYRDEPAILGWELANEPRSSDPSGNVIARWLEETGSFLRTVDPVHLIGSGEEGFDTTPDGYAASAGLFPAWAFNGSAGISFRQNVSIPSLDFASVHLYSDSWGTPPAGGSPWIADHARVALTGGKPLLLGEFGARSERPLLFESWLTTALLEGASGALAWQLLAEGQSDGDGFGFHCETDPACPLLARFARRFVARAEGGEERSGLLRIAVTYPDPVQKVALLAYDLPEECWVEGELFDITGARVGPIVEGRQSGGGRREIIDARRLASGAYVLRLHARSLTTSWEATAAGKLMVIH
jgi:mannan endo-1,4-beta-mannosidase